jgi:hypothetical protein
MIPSRAPRGYFASVDAINDQGRPIELVDVLIERIKAASRVTSTSTRAARPLAASVR